MLPKSPIGCPMDSLLRLLMGPWTTYILWVLASEGPTRFGALKRRVPGISAKVLTERLRTLEEAGVIYRQYEPTIPPKVTYGLAPRGQELRAVLDQLNAVALRWQRADGAVPADYVCVPAGSDEEPAPAGALAEPRLASSRGLG
jgi:DNA-binding HxlR family transcriptional regulator